MQTIQDILVEYNLSEDFLQRVYYLGSYGGVDIIDIQSALFDAREWDDSDNWITVYAVALKLYIIFCNSYVEMVESLEDTDSKGYQNDVNTCVNILMK